METLLANFSGKVRREKLNGRNYLVAPMTLIVPGVLNGSKGPLFYPPEEIKRDPGAWNHMPIVVYHPEKDGQPVSARRPEILNKQGIGLVFHSEANGKLTSEAWFDEERTKLVDSRVYSKLRKGEPIEVSTGLFTDNEKAPEDSKYRGKRYDFIGRNYRPDHLAVLPDQKGACSLKDGCGILNENEDAHDDNDDGLTKNVIRKLKNGGYRVMSHEGRNLGTFRTLAGANKRLKQVEYFKHAQNSEENADMPMTTKQRKAVINALVANCECEKANVWSEDDREILENMDDDKLVALKEQRDAQLEQDETARTVANGVKEGNTTFVFNTETKKLVVSSMDGKDDDSAVDKGKKKKMKKMMETNEENDDEPKQNSELKPQTLADWQKTAPPEVLQAFQTAQQIQNGERDRLIEQLTANVVKEQKESTVNQLKTKPLPELQMWASLMPQRQQMQPQPNYFGMGVPLVNQSSEDDDDEDVLVTPTINWQEPVTGKRKTA